MQLKHTLFFHSDECNITGEVLKHNGCVYSCICSALCTQECRQMEKIFMLQTNGSNLQLLCAFPEPLHISSVCQCVWNIDWKGVVFKCSWLEGIYGFAISSTLRMNVSNCSSISALWHSPARCNGTVCAPTSTGIKKKELHGHSYLHPLSFMLHCQVRGLIMHLSVRV